MHHKSENKLPRVVIHMPIEAPFRQIQDLTEPRARSSYREVLDGVLTPSGQRSVGR